MCLVNVLNYIVIKITDEQINESIFWAPLFITCLQKTNMTPSHLSAFLRWQNHAGVSEKVGSVSSGCCQVCPNQGCSLEPSTLPPVPQYPHPVQWNRSVGEGLSDRDPTPSGRMVAPTNHGSVAEGYTGGGETAFSLQLSEVLWVSRLCVTLSTSLIILCHACSCVLNLSYVFIIII